jgi:hypothetical protein
MDEKETFVQGFGLGIAVALVFFWIWNRREGQRAKRNAGNVSPLRSVPLQGAARGDEPPNPSLDATSTAV